MAVLIRSGYYGNDIISNQVNNTLRISDLGMYVTSKLVPAKFLTLIAHFAIVLTLICSSKESAKICLPENHTQQLFDNQHYQLVLGLVLSLSFIAFELIAFLIGLTMFHNTSALISIGCHGCACLILTYLVMEGWQCGWYWIVFGLFSIWPVVNDLTIISDIIFNKKY